MPRHTETRHLPFTPEQLFDLVADVGRYQEFLPWVAAVRIRSDSEIETVADLVVGFRALKETFTSKVHKRRPHEIEIDYVEGTSGAGFKFHNPQAQSTCGCGSSFST